VPEVVSDTSPLHYLALLDHLDLASLDRNKMSDASMRPKVRQALVLIMKQVGGDLPGVVGRAAIDDEDAACPAGERGQGVGQVGRFVEGNDHGRDGRHHVGG